jgi:hypothetical protein
MNKSEKQVKKADGREGCLRAMEMTWRLSAEV